MTDMTLQQELAMGSAYKGSKKPKAASAKKKAKNTKKKYMRGGKVGC